MLIFLVVSFLNHPFTWESWTRCRARSLRTMTTASTTTLRLSQGEEKRTKKKEILDPFEVAGCGLVLLFLASTVGCYYGSIDQARASSKCNKFDLTQSSTLLFLPAYLTVISAYNKKFESTSPDFSTSPCFLTRSSLPSRILRSTLSWQQLRPFFPLVLIFPSSFCCIVR